MDAEYFTIDLNSRTMPNFILLILLLVNNSNRTLPNTFRTNYPFSKLESFSAEAILRIKIFAVQE